MLILLADRTTRLCPGCLAMLRTDSRHRCRSCDAEAVSARHRAPERRAVLEVELMGWSVEP
jgi:predicted amidophosphoribosyltransferase